MEDVRGVESGGGKGCSEVWWTLWTVQVTSATVKEVGNYGVLVKHAYHAPSLLVRGAR
jgi:hypothetical protein